MSVIWMISTVTGLYCTAIGENSLWGQIESQEPPPWVKDAVNRPPAPTAPPPPEATVLTNMQFRPVEPGVFELGKLRFHKTNRQIIFPAFVNSHGGPIEYFLVTTYGKTHESVLRTETEPIHLQLALLLLDAKGDPNPLGLEGAVSNAPSISTLHGPVSNPADRVLKGDKVQIEVSWSAEGKKLKCPAEQLVFNQASSAALKPDNWVYNGSLVINGQFLSQMDGSLVSLITDPAALINNASPGHENDNIWTINTNRVPAMNTPVEVTIKLKP